MNIKSPILIASICLLALTSCQTAKKVVGFASEIKPNEGPCPIAYVLWDASRKVQISKPEVFTNVGFTGEIERVRSYCTYVGMDPIEATLEIDFAFGRGPAAVGMELDYPYFVSVTRKNRAVITKESYNMHVKFRDPDQIIRRTEKFSSIVIPRKQKDTSGGNFEIIVGFELNEAELAYARSGKRFRVDAGSGN